MIKNTPKNIKLVENDFPPTSHPSFPIEFMLRFDFPNSTNVAAPPRLLRLVPVRWNWVPTGLRDSDMLFQGCPGHGRRPERLDRPEQWWGRSTWRPKISDSPELLRNRQSTQQGWRSTVADGGRRLQVARQVPTSLSRRGEQLSLLWLFELRPGSAEKASSPPRLGLHFRAPIRPTPAATGWRSGWKRTARRRASFPPMDGGRWWPVAAPTSSRMGRLCGGGSGDGGDDGRRCWYRRVEDEELVIVVVVVGGDDGRRAANRRPKGRGVVRWWWVYRKEEERLYGFWVCGPHTGPTLHFIRPNLIE